MLSLVSLAFTAWLTVAGVWAQVGTPAEPQTSGLQRLQNALLNAEKTAPDQSSPAYRTNYPYALLQLKKARLLSAKSWGFSAASQEQYIRDGLAALERLERGEVLYAQRGVLSELAYVTANDGTVQPYHLYLPRNFDPSRNWPLIVFLHGYVPSTSVLEPWVLGEDVCRVADENGCMLLIPYGRRNTDFQGVGEVDVLAATEEVKALYPVDPMRVYMSGVSMGGMGAWNMALRHPGMYAATTPISGQTDMHTWWPRVLPGWPKSRDDIPPFRRFLVEWDNPIDLVMNARNQPIFVQHGEMDSLIPVQQTRTMVAAAAALGIPIKVYEFPGASHYIYWDTPCFENAWSWAKQFTLDPSPRHITYKTYSLEYDTAFWLQIMDFVQWGQPAIVDCEVSLDGTSLQITTSNVRLVRVDVNQAPLQKLEHFDATVNGRHETVRATDNGELFVVCDSQEAPSVAWPPRKRKGLCGPVEEVFDGPFVVVVGTAGDDTADQENASHAQRWATEWDKFADGLPRVKVDQQVTESDIEQYNLVLFGTPRTNSVLGRMADRLPIAIGEHEYTVAGRTYRGEDLGLVMCYPNPLAPNRYVAIYAGELYGEKCGINHKHDLIPDFIVFTTRRFSYDDTNEHEVAGYFDMNWQLNETLTWVRVPQG